MSFWILILAIWFPAVSFLGDLTTHLGWVLLKRGAISETEQNHLWENTRVFI